MSKLKSSPTAPTLQQIDELELLVNRFSERVSENLHFLSNEPSLAFYRMQEHVRRTVPLLIETKNEAARLQAGLQGRHFDLENSIKAVDSMVNAAPTFQRIYELCRSTMYHKQQLDYEKCRRSDVRPAMYHSDSSDSLVQELRKSKSLGALMKTKPSISDLASECGSVVSRSTTSTPVSEYPESCATGGPDLPDASREDELQAWMLHRQKMKCDGLIGDEPSSSTTTSGADSPESPGSGEDKSICDNSVAQNKWTENLNVTI